MIRFASAHLWVHDQDEALSFYTEKLGMEVRSDVTVAEMGNFRWLSVGPVGQPDVSIVLMAVSSPPIPDVATVAQVLDLAGKGQANGIRHRCGVPRPIGQPYPADAAGTRVRVVRSPGRVTR